MTKKTSIFLAPFNLLHLAAGGVRFVLTLFKITFVQAKDENGENHGIHSEKAKIDYVQIAKEFEDRGFSKKWKTYILYSLLIQIGLLLLTLWHLSLGSYIIALEVFVLWFASVLFLGYRPWIRRNEMLISFIDYVLYGIKKDPGSLLLWKSLDLDKNL